MSDRIVLERRERVTTLTIDHPPLNILDLAAIRQLHRILSDLADDTDLQLVVLRGSGTRAFSAGVAVEDHSPDLVPAMLAEFHGAISTLRDLPAASVAVVQGHCLGGGMELAAGCDLIIATDDSTFGQPEIKLGCYPPLAAALYPTLLGHQRTTDLLLTGRTMSSQEAHDIGFISRLVASQDLSTTVDQVVESITRQSLAVTRLTKQAIRAGRDRDFAAALTEAERIYLEELIQTQDMHEGLAAFMEKRPPKWQHR